MSNFVNTPSDQPALYALWTVSLWSVVTWKNKETKRSRNKRAEESAARSKGEAKDMQELVQEEAGDQIQEEQHKGWVEGGGAEV